MSTRSRPQTAKREERISEILSEEEKKVIQLSKESAERIVSRKKLYRLDRKWLLEEMSKDLAPLRMLLGFSMDEMGSMIGVSLATYKNLETGKREMSWDQLMALLFLFHYNERTATVVDSLGLFPEALKYRMQKGFVMSY